MESILVLIKCSMIISRSQHGGEYSQRMNVDALYNNVDALIFLLSMFTLLPLLECSLLKYNAELINTHMLIC